ncbi:response regulator [Arthrobacter alpinus]|uniref:response regulator n=1 Tax=Arthrobacter alpinus TaxID=656366 RepID=UPI0009F28B8D|nr:response regulator [Arthrobacter alpinus]
MKSRLREVVAEERLDPVLVTLDIGLPDMNGQEVARQIREVSRASILFLTDREGPGDEMAGMVPRAAAYLVKPFRPQQLREITDQLCPANRVVS